MGNLSVELSGVSGHVPASRSERTYQCTPHDAAPADEGPGTDHMFAGAALTWVNKELPLCSSAAEPARLLPGVRRHVRLRDPLTSLSRYDIWVACQSLPARVV